MKREYVDERYPSLEEQISERKKLLEHYKLDMVYGQEALSLLANRKRVEADNYIQGKVGTEQYKEDVINYLVDINNHLLRYTNSAGSQLITVGTEIFIDDNINNVFASKVDNTLSGVFAFYYNHLGDKQLVVFTFEYLNLALPEYSVNTKPSVDTFAPTGKFVYPYNEEFHDVYDKAKKCDTHLDLWNTLKNSCIKVCEVKPYHDSIYWKDEVSKRSSTPSLRRKRSVPLFVFCFAHKERQSIAHYMNNRHLYRGNYRAYKGENGKWGICIDKTGEEIVDCFFDKIVWWKKHVQFYKDGKIAICRIEQIENLK
jgi:hypothetical protein